jgi:hypothetical protein
MFSSLRCLGLLSPIVFLAACSPGFMMVGGGAPPGATMSAHGASGPSHSPATDAQWAVAESAALDASKAAGAERVDPPIRVNETGIFAAKHVIVEGGRCYKVGIAWSFDAALNTSVNFAAGTNLSRAGFNRKIASPSGVLDFCADGSGAVDLTFSSVPPAGGFVGSDLLQYAVVVGSTKENAAARVARRKTEAVQAQNSREVHAATEARIASDNAAADKKHQDACNVCKARFQGCTTASCNVAFSHCTFEEADDTRGWCRR